MSCEEDIRGLRELEELEEEDKDPDYVPPTNPATSTRKSSRLKGKDRYDYHFSRKSRDSNRIWEEREKKTFLEAVKKYGTKDWKRVAACIPSKSEDVIKGWILREKRNQTFKIERRLNKPDGTFEVITNGLRKLRGAEVEDLLTPDQRENLEIEEVMTKQETLAPLDKWIEIIEEGAERDNKRREAAGQGKLTDGSKIVPMSLRWIAEFENHPDPEKCGGVDYASIYRYFAHLSEGEVPADLNPATAARVTRLVSDLSELVSRTPLEKETQYLENYRGTFTRFRTSEHYQEKSKHVKVLGDLSRVPGMNPLNLHLELFAQRDIDTQGLVLVAKDSGPTQPEQ